jgi:hypothetical protein
LFRRPRVIVHVPPAAEPGRARSVEVGEETLELLPFKPVPGEVLAWRQPRFMRAEYWLESSRGAHLLVRDPSPFFRKPRECTVDAAAESWTVKMGWGLGWQPMPLRDRDGNELMRQQPGTFGRGHVALADGSRLAWRRNWTTRELRDPGDQLLFEVKRSFAWLRSEAIVTLTDAARARADLLPLLGLTWLAVLDARHRRRHR